MLRVTSETHTSSPMTSPPSRACGGPRTQRVVTLPARALQSSGVIKRKDTRPYTAVSHQYYFSPPHLSATVLLVFSNPSTGIGNMKHVWGVTLKSHWWGADITATSSLSSLTFRIYVCDPMMRQRYQTWCNDLCKSSWDDVALIISCWMLYHARLW